MSKSFIENAPDRVDNANQTICSCIETIKSSADLYVKLTENGRSTVSGLGNRFYAKGIEEFFLEKRVPIPPELFQEMNHMRSHLTMGLFPEVKRAYVTIDCDIYLWSYEADADLAVFDGVPNTILKLCLAKPRPGVFQSHITHVLVVGTVADIMLFGITNGIDEGLSLIPEPLFKVDLDGQMIKTIVSTDSGRIFFTAKDVLYEFEYQEKGWLGRSCKKVDKSTSLFDSIASYIKPVADGIEEAAIDKTRNILYTLTSKSSIQVFDLGVRGDECIKSVTLNIGQIMHEATAMTRGQHEASFFSTIVALSPIPSTQSYRVNVVATTSKGVRLYFSCLAKQPPAQQGYMMDVGSSQLMSLEESRPSCLRLIHVRLSPGICPSSLYSQAPQGVYAASVDSTLSVMTTSGRDTVFALSNLYHPQQDVETMNELSIEGHVWAMASEGESKVRVAVIPSGAIPPLEPHPFYTQLYTPKQELLLFTTNALYIFMHRSPLDALRAALAEKGRNEGERVMELCKSLGAINSLVMAISILASDTSSDLQLKDKAARLVFGWKDESEIVDSHTMRLVSPGDKTMAEWERRMKSPLHASTPVSEMGGGMSGVFSSPFSPPSQEGPYQWKPSAKHDALYAYFSRLVYPIWNSSLAAMNAKGEMILCISSNELEWMGQELVKFGRAMDEFNLVPKMNVGGGGDTSIHGRFMSEAQSRERQSLFGLRMMATQTAETLFLWATAGSQGINQVTLNIGDEARREMCERRCAELATNPKLNSIVIKALIEYFLGDDAGTKELSERLRRLCPNLYSKEDALVTAALEIVERILASPSPSSSSHTRMIEEAVRLFKESVTKLPLEQVAQKLIKLRAFEAVVDLALLRAARDDPKHLAINVYRNGGNVDPETSEVVAKRWSAYTVMTRMMDEVRSASSEVTPTQRNVEVDEIMKGVLRSDDELAHAAVLRWLMSRGEKEKIVDSKSPFVEQWLSIEIARGGGVKYLDVMWRYYEKNGMKGKAAKLLNRLTDSELAEITLNDRLSYLSHAMMCAQSTSDSESRSLIQELRDKLEVAQIQMAIKDTMDARGQDDAVVSRELNGRLLPLQDLCVKYAVPYKMAKIQLEIFKCANFYQEDKIQSVWRQLLDREFESCSDGGGSTILGTIADLRCKFGDSNYFPTEVICVHVVERCFEYGIDPSFFIGFLSKMNLSLAVFLTLLSQHYREGDPFWRENANAHDYMVVVAITVVEDFITNSRKYSDSQRMALSSKCEAALSQFAVHSRSLSSHSSSSLLARLDRVSTILANMN